MTGILAVFNDIPSHLEGDFNDWYNEQHVLERFGVPGFLSGRRYRGVNAAHRYFAWYETAFPSVMKSVDYVDRLEDPTAWTARVMPGFSNMVRTVCTRTVRAGEGTGGAVATLQLGAATTKDSAALHDAIGQILDAAGVVGVEHWAADHELSVNNTTESRMRDGADKFIDGLLMIQAMDQPSLEPLVKSLPKQLRGHGLDCSDTVSTWQLLFSAT